MSNATAAGFPAVGSSPLRCAWLGPTSDGLGWLRFRVGAARCDWPPIKVHQYPAINLDVLQSLVAQGGVDRIILACSTRLDYPLREIEFLQRDCPDVPLAVACGSWWDGARRTGLGAVQHLSLPWYRWWDGWTAWLEGRAPEMFGPCQASVAPWLQSSRFARRALEPRVAPAPLETRRGMVVGNCRSTCDVWSLSAEACGFQVEIMSWEKFQRGLPEQMLDPEVHWILWDDSCLNTSRGGRTNDPAMELFFQHTRRGRASLWLIAAVSMPRADQWLVGRLTDRQEFIVKPDGGQALTRLLNYIRHLS